MSNNTLVTIIVPVYKVEQYLVRCVDSVLAQTYRNCEIILVDDGSPDNCPVICDEFAKKDSRIKVVHKVNGGLSSARLAGFKEASGEYILFVDSDDYIENNMVEEMVSAIVKTDSDMSVCGYFTQYETRKLEYLLPYDKHVLEGKEEISKKYILPLVGTLKGDISIPGFLCIRMLKRTLINESFFVSENKVFAEDIVFDLLYSDFVSRIAIVNIPLYHYCVNGQSLTNKYRKNKWQMLKNLYDFKRTFLSERSIIGAEVRLQNAIASSVFAAVDNAVVSANYKSYIAEVKLLTKDAKEIIKKADKNPLHGTVALTMFLLNLRAYFVVYHLRKSRMK